MIATWYPLSHGLRRASSPKGRAKGRALPAQRIEISVQLIRWHRLRRGGYPLNYGVIAPGDHWILIRCAAHNPYERTEISAR